MLFWGTGYDPSQSDYVVQICQLWGRNARGPVQMRQLYLLRCERERNGADAVGCTDCERHAERSLQPAAREEPLVHSGRENAQVLQDCLPR